ncbi:hypothetical protein LNKW23_10980 [Paralimibaculum aggregatum]|uniref:Uncharacterized protein n=1 Tax=Paralimibaculum aggregatum TaxID=3036245 RepID=A0ABQ6LEX0_9RHOB|nr:hypothetical protein [Limibaculum sp. NKW23]GMG81885.1 hypothetical protein LNKW23_10980 [Limibaculum sp. NKW23]
MGRLLKYVLWVVILGLIALVAYAALWELPAPVEEITVPLPLPAGSG